jgi:uncharacterized protein
MRGPRLVGVIHLPPLPGSPRSERALAEIADGSAADARVLEEAGFDLAMLENFGDAPFFRGKAPAVTVSAMTVCALAVKRACPRLALGINVLRNDADAALSIAACVGAAAIRVNVHSGARVTDQGVVEGEAAETLRLRRALGVACAIWADVDVKHSAPLAPRAPEEEAHDLVTRGLADAILVTGEGTGLPVDLGKLARVRGATKGTPLLVASGATSASLMPLADHSDGVIVGSALRADGIAGGPIDRGRALAFANAFRATFGE